MARPTKAWEERLAEQEMLEDSDDGRPSLMAEYVYEIANDADPVYTVAWAMIASIMVAFLCVIGAKRFARKPPVACAVFPIGSSIGKLCRANVSIHLAL